MSSEDLRLVFSIATIFTGVLVIYVYSRFRK